MAGKRTGADMRQLLLQIGYALLTFLLALLLIALVARAVGPASAGASYSYGIPFEWRIVDGDTISTTQRPRKYFRLVGYDAPEITRPRCEAELLHGARAKLYLKGLLESPNLLFLDTGNLDRYGRNLVHFWLGGRRVSELMITAGYGVESNGKSRIDWCGRLHGKAVH